MSPTSASSRELATLLAERIAPHLPANARLEPDDGLVVVVINGVEDSRAGAALILNDDDGRTPEEAVETATLGVLSHVQDRVALDSAEPWPASSGHELPLPGVRIEDGSVLAWFGDPSSPTLGLVPFPVPGPSDRREER